MNLTTLLLAPLATAGFLAVAPQVPKAETPEQLSAFLAQLDAGMSEVAGESAPAAEPAASPRQRAGLYTGRVQGASGVDSGAQGLSGKDEWQSRFPRYSKQK